MRNKHNTPAIIKYPFWRMTNQWPDATYVCINLGEAYAPHEIEGRFICLRADIGDILARLRQAN